MQNLSYTCKSIIMRKSRYIKVGICQTKSTKDVLSILLLFTLFVCLFNKYILHPIIGRGIMNVMYMLMWIILFWSSVFSCITLKNVFIDLLRFFFVCVKEGAVLRVGCIERENCAVITNNGWYVVIVKRFIWDEVGGGVSCRLNNTRKYKDKICANG